MPEYWINKVRKSADDNQRRRRTFPGVCMDAKLQGFSVVRRLDGTAGEDYSGNRILQYGNFPLARKPREAKSGNGRQGESVAAFIS